MSKYDLTPTAKAVMEYFWQFPEGLSFRAVYDHFTLEEKRDWKRQTLFTYITILVNQGYLRAEGTRRKSRYIPVISKDAYMQHYAQSVLQNDYDNSLYKFAAAFCQGNSISSEEAAELMELLKSFQE